MAVGYSECLISYIDVLGFRDLMKDRDADGVLSVLGEFQNTLDEHGYRWGGDFVISFADTIVRCRPISEGSGNDKLFHELAFLAERQFQLACQGVLIRGALLRGDVCGQGNSAFGPGIAEAYELERAWAIYPRVVVDRELALELKTSPSRGSYIRCADDGTHFLDYLPGSLIGLVRTPEAEADGFDERLRRLQGAIQERLERHGKAVSDKVGWVSAEKRDARVRQKVTWLARYHNDALSRMRQENPLYLFKSRDDAFRADGATPVTVNFGGYAVPSSRLDW